jgi:threonine dehydrogenase-like Zn-dependent dehydrogenase
MRPREYRGMIIQAPRTPRVQSERIRTPGPGELRLRLQGSGVCASNVPVWEGRDWFHYPLPAGAPGHEGWGFVEELGEGVAGFDVGQRVAFLSERAYAEIDVAPAAAVVPLPAELDDQPFPGEPLGCAMNIFERSDIGAGDTVAIVGTGFLGLLLTQLASRAGADVVALSRREFALRLARERGARETLRSDEGGEVVARALALTGGRGFDRVIEAGGEQSTLDLASALVAEHGRLIIAGYHQDGKRQVDMQSWNWRGIDVINAHERSLERQVRGVRAAVDAVLAGQLDPLALFTHALPLESLGQALELTSTRPDGFVKSLVLCESA